MSDRDTDKPKDLAEVPADGGFLRRWSQRKHAVARGDVPVEPAPVAVPPGAPVAEELPLPDPATLTLADDFSVFLRDKVPPALKRKAMQHLFSHPEFNEVDMLDVYMEDFNLVPDLSKEDFALVKHAKAVLDPTPSEAVAGQTPEAEAPPPMPAAADGEPVEPEEVTESDEDADADADDAEAPAGDPSRASPG